MCKTVLCTRDSSVFPDKLLDPIISPKVERFWYKGRLSKGTFNKCAAVVGSRKMTRYGRQAIEEIVPRLCGAGYAIISGLMYGVDQVSHRATLECGGQAIAVLGYGIERKNSEEADKLAREIIAHDGLVISEYEGNARGQTWTFPQRNRIVVGLTDVVVIIEAGEKSGSLSTANWAKRMKKPIYAVPGSIFSSTSEGTNGLIKEGLATALTLPVLSELTGIQKIKSKDREENIKNMSAGEREVYMQLKMGGPQSVNEISRSLAISVREVVSFLSQMEMREIVGEERGVWSTN